MKPEKEILIFILVLLVLSNCICNLTPIYAVETAQRSTDRIWDDSVEPSTVISYKVTNGNLYFGQYTYEGSELRTKYIHLIGADQSITEAIIPPTINGLSVFSIRSKAFADCIYLKSVTIPTTVMEIAETGFIGCTSLMEIMVDEGNHYYYSSDGALISNCVAENNVFLISSVIQYPPGRSEDIFVIPDGVEIICPYSFSGAKELQSIYVPSSVASIEIYAFENCQSLKEIFYDGTSAQWEKIYKMCADTPFMDAQIHFNETAEKKVEYAEKFLDSEAGEMITYLMQNRPVLFRLLVSSILLALSYVLVRFIMSKSIKERKRYLHYSSDIEAAIRKSEHLEPYPSDIVFQAKPYNIRAILICITVSLIVLYLLIEDLALYKLTTEIEDTVTVLQLAPILKYFGLQNRISNLRKTYVWIPILSIVLFLAVLVVGILLVRMRNKIRNKRRPYEKIHMRIRVVNSGRRDET